MKHQNFTNSLCITLLLGVTSIFFSCKPSSTVRSIALRSQTDSVSYAMAYMTGYLHASMYQDPTGEGVVEYISAFDEGYRAATHATSDSTPQVNIKNYEHPYMGSRGYRLGISFNHWEQTGLIKNVPIALSHPIFRQGLINGLYKDTTIMTMSRANEYMRSARPDLFTTNH